MLCGSLCVLQGIGERIRHLQESNQHLVLRAVLPPEVRRREAERFATGQTEVLVATDAIGMGLNLPIQRVIFSTMTKYDGVAADPVTARKLKLLKLYLVSPAPDRPGAAGELGEPPLTVSVY